MKKIIFVFLSVLFMLNFDLISAYAENGTVRARHLNRTALTEVYQGYKVTDLTESCGVKTAQMSVYENEMLILHSGVTLRLYQGARIDGTVYIENGGKMILSGGTLSVSRGGAVFSDGLLRIDEKGCVSVDRGGELFIGKNGRLKISSEKNLRIHSMSSVACLGRSNSKNKQIGKTVLSAYVLENSVVSLAEKPSSLLTNGTDYCTDFSFEAEKNLSKITFVFDNGACFKALRDGEQFAYFGNSCMAMIGSHIFNNDNSKHFCAVYEIEGRDYILDLESGGVMAAVDKSGKLVDAKGKRLSGPFGKFDQKRSKALGSLSDYLCGAIEDFFVDAQAYLLSDSFVLVMTKTQDPAFGTDKEVYSVCLLKRSH